MNGGVTFVAIFGGSLFFTCSDRERGRNADKMAQRKNKIKSKSKGKTQKFKLIETHRCVCVVCVLWAGMDQSEERDTRLPAAENQRPQCLTAELINLSVHK